jgi:hypothetical protein
VFSPFSQNSIFCAMLWNRPSHYFAHGLNLACKALVLGLAIPTLILGLSVNTPVLAQQKAAKTLVKPSFSSQPAPLVAGNKYVAGKFSTGKTGGSIKTMLIPYWTRSYQLYKHPHALWLSNDFAVGANLGLVKQALTLAENTKQTPELVVYNIPLRDLGQSSEGGFKTYADYLSDNQLVAKEIEAFVKNTGLKPRIYLEPDALALCLDYIKSRKNDAEAQRIYQERIKIFPQIIELYKTAGALVYLDAAHSGWFDYGDADVQNIASILNDARIDMADGIVTNVSNRQKLQAADGQSESHYLSRLLPLLNHKNLDVVVDTSRNGGNTSPRLYHLALNGQLIDNELPQGRLVGSWRKDEPSGEIYFNPFWGTQKTLSGLLTREKYQFDSTKMILIAPPWLDPVGDVKLGLAPTDSPPGSVKNIVQKLRFIKPPDDCDGSLNCPPGQSKFDINQQTLKLQPATLSTDKGFWQSIITQVVYK